VQAKHGLICAWAPKLENLPGKLDLAFDAAHVQGMVHKSNPHKAPVALALFICARLACVTLQASGVRQAPPEN
jgi:hypothetical protein